MIDEAVVICPVIPTGLPKVCPISIRRRLDINIGIPVINLEKAKVGSTIFPVCEGFLIVSPLKAISLSYSFTK
jgi:hypothetical protein